MGMCRGSVWGSVVSRLLFVLMIIAAVAQHQAAEARSLAAARTTEEIFTEPAHDAYTLAVRAYVWGYPLVEAGKIRLKRTTTGAPLNALRHERTLADPSRRTGVGPNNDTLYSTGWLDLAQEPYVLESPNFGRRYYTFQLAFADTAAEQSLGQRTHGAQLPPVFIYGPAYRGSVPTGMIGARGRTRYLLIAGRILVRGAEDFGAVHALQDQIRLRTWSAYKAGATGPNPVPRQRLLVDRVRPAPKELAFFEMLGNVLRDWAVSKEDRALVASFAAIGLTPAHGFVPDRLSPEVRAALVQGLADGERIVLNKSKHLGTNVNGWTINYRGPRFGGDYLLRAGVAKDQIFVTIPEEAIYPIARVDADGQPLDCRNSYRIRMSKGALPPVGAFWSITLYDDQGFMVPNPINRYSVGDRTAGLVTKDDGSVEIRLQNSEPPAAAKTNWLPAPQAPFYLMMRLYIPGKAVLDRTWLPPRIENLAGAASAP